MRWRATPITEIAGYGTTADAYHMTSGPPDGNGARRAIAIALRQARLAPVDLQHLNAHATSTPAGDEGELGAIAALFGRDRGNRGECDEIGDRSSARRGRRT